MRRWEEREEQGWGKGAVTSLMGGVSRIRFLLRFEVVVDGAEISHVHFLDEHSWLCLRGGGWE